MPFCDKCGKTMNEDAKFCRECGARVDDSIQISDSPKSISAPTPNNITSLTPAQSKGAFIFVIGMLAFLASLVIYLTIIQPQTTRFEAIDGKLMRAINPDQESIYQNFQMLGGINLVVLFLSFIIMAGGATSYLLSRFYEHNGKEKHNVRTVSLNSIVADTVEMLERSLPGKIRILDRLATDLPPVNVDADLIQQAVLNVGLNAGDAMPCGGDIVIETERVTMDATFCAAHPGFQPGTWCAVHVRDSGGGTPPISRENFEPSFTAKDQDCGTDLSLSITLGIVRNHGGSILVDETPGVGTVVSLFLPAAARIRG